MSNAIALSVLFSYMAIVVPGAQAQEATIDRLPVSTPVSENSCFVIFQSPRQMKETYQLDRCTGRSWVMVSSNGDDESLTWQLLERQDNEDDTKTAVTGPRYVISVSGIAAKGTYLYNTANGASWQLVSADGGSTHWQALPRECTSQTMSAQYCKDAF